jgi:O-antigen/teichoic acid export membrane protein
MTSPSLGIRFVRNVLWNFGGQLWSLGLAFFTTPYIVHRLGTDAYGLLMTVGIMTSYLWFMDLGLGGASVKYIAEHAARNEWDEVRRILWSSWIAYLFLGALAATVLVLITPLAVYRWFRIPPELQESAVAVFHLSALGFLVGMLNNAPAAIPRALQRFDIVNRISILIGTLQTLLAVGLLALGYSVRAVVAGNLAVAVLSLGIHVGVARRLFPQWGRPRLEAGILRRLIRFGGWLTVSSLAGPILVHLEKIILAHQISTAAVAYYTVPYSLVSRFWILSGAFSGALFPLFSSLHGSGFHTTVVDLNARVTRIVALLLLPLVIFCVVFGRDFLEFWMGPDFAARSTGALQILAIAMLVNAIAWSPYVMLQASGRPDLTAKFHLAELVVHLPLTLVFVRLWGVTGAALAWFFRVALDTSLIYGAAIRLYRLDWRSWVRAIAAPATGIMVATGVILGLSRELVPADWSSVRTLIIVGGSTMLITGISLWRWGLRRGEYRLLLQALGVRGER